MNELSDSFDLDRLPPILDVAQLAELLRLNPQIVRKYAKDGTIPSYQLPNSRVFRFIRDEIIDYLQSHPVVPSDESEHLSEWRSKQDQRKVEDAETEARAQAKIAAEMSLQQGPPLHP